MKNCAVILAGGEGKRMKSDKPKTLSEVLGRPMLCWVMSALRKAGIDDICVVKGFKKECVEEYLSTLDFSVESVFQAERLGTGHAVMMAKDFLKKHSGNVVILNGDAPFMDSKTIEDSLKLISRTIVPQRLFPQGLTTRQVTAELSVTKTEICVQLLSRKTPMRKLSK
mgnify:CR=1 FL=1